MTKNINKTFNLRYEKFKKSTLPTPFWDKEREVLEYVFYEKNEYNVCSNLSDALSNKFSLYYPFNCLITTKDGIRKIGQCHEHTFEDVVRDLYNYPVSFSISKKDEKYYSNQELDYLMILKNYLLLVGLDDIPDVVKISRYRNKLVKKYQNAIIIKSNNREINDIIKGKRVFFAVKKNRYNKDLKIYTKGEMQYLIVDEKNKFRLLIEYVEKKKQKYEEIKKQVKVSTAKDNDDMMIYYFKIIEMFK